MSSPSVPCSTSLSITVSLSSDEMLPAVAFPFRFPSVELSGVITYSYFSASPCSAIRSPVSSPFSSNPSHVTILFMLSIICLRSSTSPTSLVTSLHPLHVNTQVPPRISAQELVHPDLSKSTQLLQVPQTKCLLAIIIGLPLFPEGAMSRSNDSM